MVALVETARGVERAGEPAAVPSVTRRTSVVDGRMVDKPVLARARHILGE